MKKKDEGFTLIEVVVVVAMIALISAFSVPKVRNYLAKGKDAKAIVLLNRLRMASEMYYTEEGKSLGGDKLGSLSNENIQVLLKYLDLNAEKSFCEDGKTVEVGGSTIDGKVIYGGTIGFTFSAPIGSKQSADGVYIWFEPQTENEKCSSGKSWTDY